MYAFVKAEKFQLSMQRNYITIKNQSINENPTLSPYSRNTYRNFNKIEITL